MSAPEFLNEYGIKIAAIAAKEGWVKAKGIGQAVKDFDKKTAEDDTGIDYDNLKIDPDTVTMNALFDGDSKKTLIEFINDYNKQKKEFPKQIKEVENSVQDEAKDAGLKVTPKIMANNGIDVANVINNEDNKGKPAKVLQKKLDTEIKHREIAEDAIKKLAEFQKKIDDLSKQIEDLKKKSASSKKDNKEKGTDKKNSKKKDNNYYKRQSQSYP
jgi:transketolase